MKNTDLRLLLDLYGLEPPHREDLLALARESTKSSVPKSVRASLPGDYADFLQAEAEAESVWNWEPQNVPGLLQTEDYARAIMLMWVSMFTLPPAEIDREWKQGGGGSRSWPAIRRCGSPLWSTNRFCTAR